MHTYVNYILTIQGIMWRNLWTVPGEVATQEHAAEFNKRYRGYLMWCDRHGLDPVGAL